MKRRKRSITEFVADSIGFPETISQNTPDVHIIGTREIAVEGCLGILVYENTEIRLRLKGRIMTVCGSHLSLKTYFASHVSVRGRIESVCFEEDRL